jgi:CBS-domain-containing membrane protein
MMNRAQFIGIVGRAAGGAVAIAVMETFSEGTAFPLAAIPFATSIVLVLGSPKAEPAQPRPLIGGHILSTVVGLVMVKLCGPALSVGLAIPVMHLTETFHPPAGIDPLVVVTNNMSWLSGGSGYGRRTPADPVRLGLAQVGRTWPQRR